MNKRVLFCLSAHGYGHVGQTAPVVEGLLGQRPELEITVRCGVPRFKLREKFSNKVQLLNAMLDIGMVQQDALNIDSDKTAQAYADFHGRWDRLLEQEKSALRNIEPDLIVANIPYLTLAAANGLGIPSLAYCSLNWAELYEHFFGLRPEAKEVAQQMLAAYNSAGCFLAPEPAMKMPGLNNMTQVGPVAQVGNDNSESLRRSLGLGADTIIVLISLGGMGLGIDTASWPRLDGIHLLVPASWNSQHPDTSQIEDLDYSFSDLLRSVNVLLAKPGYGSFVEACCAGIPVLYLPRPQWPEAPILIEWLEKQGNCFGITLDQLVSGNLQDAVRLLVSRGPCPVTEPSGCQKVVNVICDYL